MRVLYTGGARSGKSRQAQKVGERLGKRRLYVATAEPMDREMESRIERHRTERGASWATVEEPLEPGSIIMSRGREFDVILLDCLTLWVCNLLCDGIDDEGFDAAIASLVSAMTQCPSNLLVVTNEVGLGIVPADPFSRRYRDMLGWANQRVATVCDRVVMMIAGFPLLVKEVEA